MCEVCEHLEAKITKARIEANPEKERVMRVILENHRILSHPKHSVVAIDQSLVVWSDGTRWIVARQ